MSDTSQLPVLVVGAGVAGLTAALEMAETGHEVVLAEREAVIGGRVARFHQYFPKLCPPTCGLEINARRLEENPRIRVLPSTSVTKSEWKNGRWSVRLETGPEFVNGRCTTCGLCTEACPATVTDRFNWGLAEAPAIRRPFPNAWPQRFVLEREACPESCHACVDACPEGTIQPVVQGELVPAPVGARSPRPYQPGPLVETAGAAVVVAGAGLLVKAASALTRALARWLTRRSAVTSPSAGSGTSPAVDRDGTGRQRRHRRRGR